MEGVPHRQSGRRGDSSGESRQVSSVLVAQRIPCRTPSRLDCTTWKSTVANSLCSLGHLSGWRFRWRSFSLLWRTPASSNESRRNASTTASSASARLRHTRSLAFNCSFSMERQGDTADAETGRGRASGRIFCHCAEHGEHDLGLGNSCGKARLKYPGAALRFTGWRAAWSVAWLRPHQPDSSPWGPDAGALPGLEPTLDTDGGGVVGGGLCHVGNNGGLLRRCLGTDASLLDADVPRTLGVGVEPRALRTDVSSDVNSGNVGNSASCEGLKAPGALDGLVAPDALHLPPASSSMYRAAKKSCARRLVVPSCAGDVKILFDSVFVAPLCCAWVAYPCCPRPVSFRKRQHQGGATLRSQFLCRSTYTSGSWLGTVPACSFFGWTTPSETAPVESSTGPTRASTSDENECGSRGRITTPVRAPRHPPREVE